MCIYDIVAVPGKFEMQDSSHVPNLSFVLLKDSSLRPSFSPSEAPGTLYGTMPMQLRVQKGFGHIQLGILSLALHSIT